MTVKKKTPHRDLSYVKMMTFISSVILLTVSGCTAVISEGLRQEVAEGTTFRQVMENPDAHTGKVIIWSGVILNATNVKEGTLMEILQKPASDNGRPRDIDSSEGRFLGLYPEYLDVAIYGYGREVTVGGEIQGKRILPLGEIEYTYPVIFIKEIHLWSHRRRGRPSPPPYRYYPRWYYPYPYRQLK
ncbi:MAG: Slp family lipoprotein [Thermodesulfobacteriota bacterium]|nr:Slp family lipoprotein [Thermodesulfobacteriota bacterium]